MKSKLMHTLPRFIAVGLVSFWVIFVFWSHGFTYNALVESSIWMVILGATMIAWGSSIIGAAIFVVLGVLYWAITFETFPVKTIMFVSGPLIITGLLFIADKHYSKKRLDEKTKSGGKK